jgi:predicted dinucleotide-binding enzyme
MNTTIGILGTGRMAVRLARLFADSGNQVILGSRTPERAARITRGLGNARITRHLRTGGRRTSGFAGHVSA